MHADEFSRQDDRCDRFYTLKTKITGFMPYRAENLGNDRDPFALANESTQALTQYVTKRLRLNADLAIEECGSCLPI